MATRKPVMPRPVQQAAQEVDPKTCIVCGHGCVRGDFSSVANFGVTREPHFVTSYGWMQVRYERATQVDAYMCLTCGHVQFYGRTPLAVLDPIERQKHMRAANPELDKKMRQEEKRRKEQEAKGEHLEGDDHLGV